MQEPKMYCDSKALGLTDFTNYYEPKINIMNYCSFTTTGINEMLTYLFYMVFVKWMI